MSVQAQSVPAHQLRDGRNPDHHIWCNNGTYFVHLTLLRGQRKFRLRKSLKTKDVDEARKRRDRMVAFIREKTELTLLLR